ncbi:hypothetical protein ACSBPH_01560 [Microbacterium sp. F51-2R]|jgi:hypothetical protein
MRQATPSPTAAAIPAATDPVGTPNRSKPMLNAAMALTATIATFRIPEV